MPVSTLSQYHILQMFDISAKICGVSNLSQVSVLVEKLLVIQLRDSQIEIKWQTCGSSFRQSVARMIGILSL